MTDVTSSYSNLVFEPGDVFRWSPATQTITYDTAKIDKPGGRLSLLHEISHALLGHKNYDQDLELIRMEVDAWRKTAELAKQHNVDFVDEDIEHCLDTYRDWLFARSRCPGCEQSGIQADERTYRCFICNEKWQVPVRQSCHVKRYRYN